MTSPNNSRPQSAEATPYSGVHRLRVPLAGSPLKHLNAYLLPDRDGHLLIDTGWNRDDAFQALERQINALGLAMRDIATIVLTHLHLDHCGLVERVCRVSGASVGIHAVESRLIEQRYHQVRDYALRTTEVLRRGGVEGGLARTPKDIVQRIQSLSSPIKPDFTLTDGQVLEHGAFSLKVVWTPGHSPGHMCLYEPEHRLLFAGDHVLEQITPNVGLFPHSGGNPLADYISSLVRTDSLGAELVLPAHGEPFHELGRRVGEILEHHAYRNRELIQLMERARSRQTPFELALSITWHSRGREVNWRELSPLDQRLAIFEIMAHLESMRLEGALESLEEQGVVFYSLT